MCSSLQLSNPATYKRQLQALRTALQQLDGTSSPSPLASVLLNLTPPASLQATPELKLIDETLNKSQREAVEFCLSSQVGLVWGPPGTGKTQTLVEIIRQLVRKGQRVLICGGSNLSGELLKFKLIVTRWLMALLCYYDQLTMSFNDCLSLIPISKSQSL